VSWSEFDHTVSPERVEAANRQLVTAQQVAKLARKLGDQGKGLTYERVRTLRRRAGLNVAYQDEGTGTIFYRLGDVLAAHQKYSRRTTLREVE
jgi:hypothetical protein